ncbi:hypothetical protein HHX47_DHR2000635 [Lentinula edodes]|nr:hypothetical protein HHX47_DHR2000635 [Lentinula edodes]
MLFSPSIIAGLLSAVLSALAAKEVVFMHTPFMDKEAYDSGEAHTALMNLMQSSVDKLKSGFEATIQSLNSDEPIPPWHALSLDPISEFVPCVDGYSSFSSNHTYACNNVDLYAFVPHWATGSKNRVGNDVWGWSDRESGREFGMVGQGDGTAFVEIQPDGSVDYLGRLPTQSVDSIWRDIKVIGNIAYIGSEAEGHGVQVFNLSKLLVPGLKNAPKEYNITTDLTALFDELPIGRSHNIVSHSAKPLIAAVGSMPRNDSCAAGLIFIDVSDPENPKGVGCASEDGYVHDAQCLTYHGPHVEYEGTDICYSFNEGWVVDETDQRYLLLDDELDEVFSRGWASDNTTVTYIWNIEDLEHPVLTGHFNSAVKAIDHNLYIVDGLAYEANYKAGLRVIDVSSITEDPTGSSFEEVAFFDVFPEDDDVGGVAEFSEQSEGNGNWTLPDITESPRSVTPRPTTPFSERDKRKGPRPPLPPVVVDTTARSVTPDGLPPSSPSSIRWNSLRQHVLPPSKSTHSQQSSSASLTSISAQAASRTGHAKQSSKFAQRLGFRNVVDQAKQVMVDEIQQFAHDIQRACMAAYHIELPPSVKSRIDPLHIPVGSTLSLPFISSTNLTVGGITGSANPSRSDLRQPSVSSSIAPGRVRPLYQTLINYAGPFANGSSPLPQLPLESLVISTLLVPFLTTDSASATEEDRWLSIEAFQIVIKTWNPITELVAAERSMWCVQAALSSPPPLRTRILSILWSITVPEESHYPASNAKALQTLLHGLFLLLPWISTQGADNEDSKLLSEIISEVCAGSCDQLDDLYVEEEYNALFVDADTPQRIRDAVVIEALARCLEFSPDSTRRWLLKNSVENLWSLPEEPFFTPLLTAIHSRALLSFTRALLALLSSTTHDTKSLRNDAHLVVQALQSRVFPELTSITNHTAEDAKRNVVSITFSLVSSEVKELVDWSISTMVEWYRQIPEWKDCFAKSFESLILESPWINLLKLLPPLMRLLPDDVRKPLTVILLFALNERLVDEPPPYPCLPLSSLLDSLSQSYPQIFYKPLFQCAASTREHVVVKHLCTLTALARFMPDFWIRDAEMVSIAIMGDMGMKSPGSGATQGIPGAVEHWGTARLGQSVLIVELIAQLQNMRRVRENSTNSASDTAFIVMAKFALSLEQRLSILIETKEHTSLIPLSQRLLFCMLFREIRLLTRSLKSAPWLSRFVEWFVSYNEHTDDDSDVVALRATTQVKALYALAQTGGRPSNTRRSTAILSPTPTSGTFVDENVKNIGLAAIFAQRIPILEAMSKGFEARALKLLVAMSSLIHLDDYRRIGTILWQQHLEDNDPRTLSSIMSQHVIADRAHRPFKVARPPLPFVTTDIGSGTFVLELDPSEVQDKLPLELRKKLAEIGWEDGGSPVNQQLEWIRTPMSNLPPLQVEKLDSSGNVPPSPNLSPVSSPSRSPILGEKAEELGLLRRNSTSGGPLSGFKRRAIFVPSLLQILPRIAAMTCDRSPVVAHAARTMILDLMRNDPGLLTRPVWDFLTGEGQDLPIAVTTLRAFLHSRRVLPPSMAHVMLNTLAGFLKDLAKHTENAHTLQYFAQTVPIIAKLVPQVYEMSVRDLRRNKVDVFLIPSGSLWFSSPAPPGPMFPRGPGVLDNPFDDCTTRIVSITLIRISQNMLFFAMLKRNPSEVQAVRKSMTKLVFPSLTGAEEPDLQLRDLVPSKKPSVAASSAIDVEIRGLSLTLSRGGYTLFMPVLFKVYAESEAHHGIRCAIEYAVNRFYAYHEETFVFQSLDAIAHVLALPDIDRTWIVRNIYTLFATLRRNTSSNEPDMAGIHHANKDEEREALMVLTAEEKPQAFFASLRNTGGQSQSQSIKSPIAVELPVEYESKRLEMSNFIRLFLTVIAHDLSIARAEQFLKLFRYLVPSFGSWSHFITTNIVEG